MPVLDGASLYRAMQLESRLADIPVIISTATPDRAPQGPRVIRKPVKFSRLFDAVSEAAERGR
jgi:hypothetical protein